MIVTLLRKPLNGGGILNALPCACLNIEATRVPLSGRENLNAQQRGRDVVSLFDWGINRSLVLQTYKPEGRFPANVFLAGIPLKGVPCFKVFR